jgi:hypothetical protein
LLVVKKRSGGLRAVSRIQRQREFVEQQAGVKIVFGKGRGTTTQNKSKTANSQIRQKPARYFVPDLKNWKFVIENQIITLTLLKDKSCLFLADLSLV